MHRSRSTRAFQSAPWPTWRRLGVAPVGTLLFALAALSLVGCGGSGGARDGGGAKPPVSGSRAGASLAVPHLSDEERSTRQVRLNRIDFCTADRGRVELFSAVVHDRLAALAPIRRQESAEAPTIA